ncbi:hypothetical protein NQ314_005165 [Rhamnusium bicolor]|uniref:PHD-type domain-containing protein n=1 Tax=Rhamnusium bicolor TaxID=1586634 RepID=A0AAV8ZJC0_9CUCU|nr:hypothetical protein NQ314_005165 [Rhamnusium bicolor]
METETLSSYEQSQDKHVLDESMDVNIPRNEDEESDSHESREISEENSVIQHKKMVDDNTGFKELASCDSLENKEIESNDCDQSCTNSEEDYLENKLDSDIDNEDEQLDEGKEIVEGEETNKSLNEDSEHNTDKLEDVDNYDEEEKKCNEENELLNDEERDLDRYSSNDGEKESLNDEEKDSLNDEEKDSLNNEEKDSLNNEEKDQLTDEEKDPLNDEENGIERVLLNDMEKDLLDEENQKNDPLGEENQKDENSHDVEENQKVSESLNENKGDSDPMNDETDGDPLYCKDKTQEDGQIENEGEKEKGPTADGKINSINEVDSEKIVPSIDENNEKEKTEDEKMNETKGENNENQLQEKNSEETVDEIEYEKNRDVIKDCPLLKETLTKLKNDEQQKEADGENGLEDMDMDEDFDPSLLCPDIAMEVDEAPVITNSDNVPNEGNKSPLLYEPIFSTYVDEMTGAEVSFNLTPEEQQLRLQSYGEGNPIQYSKIHCTACNVHLGSALDGQSNRFVHPLLKVLICKDCYHFYTSGEFEKDEDGSELYCLLNVLGTKTIFFQILEMCPYQLWRRKLAEIRDSDDWYCFRCNPSQLTPLRVHCAEFMEYVRREISRAATLENATTFMTTDFTQCCLSQKKKYTEPLPNEPKKKKRKSSVDPDYDPFREQDSPQPSTSGVKPQTAEAIGPVTKPVPILPRPLDPNHNAGVVTQVTSSNTLFKVGNTTFRPRSSTFCQPRPRNNKLCTVYLQHTNAILIFFPAVRPSSGPGYIKIMPGGIRVTPTTTRAQTYVSSSSIRPQPSFNQRLPRPVGNASSQMKHEWFEKTVRAAARVNSNLSYTLTQLNRAQATAASVEALAVVHNKLQEILSTSINSLIQIRKNLRTEFIAGIKNIRFPSNKPPQPQPSTSSQDDDVIFVSPTPSPVPPPVMPTIGMPPLSSLHLPPSVSLTKRTSTAGPSNVSDPIPSTSKNVMNEKPKVFLRVKSLTALQNVPSECITIPDDPLPPPPPLTPLQQKQDVTLLDDSAEKNGIQIKNVTSVVEIDPLQNDIDGNLQNVKEKLQNNTDENGITNGAKQSHNEESPIEADKDSKEVKYDLIMSYNLKDQPSPELKKMLSTKVYIKRSEEIDELVKNTFGLVNGNASE